MNMKSFLMSVLWVALFVSLGAMYWYQTSFDSRLIDMNKRAANIEDKYQGFTDRIHNLEVKFEGRAKHVRQNQQGIKKLNEDLNDFRQQHRQDLYLVNSRIDSTGDVMNADRKNSEFQVESLKKAIAALKSQVSQTNITTRNELNKLTRDLESVTKRVDNAEIAIEGKVDKKK